MKLFANFITSINRRPTKGWKINDIGGRRNGITVSCNNGTGDYIEPPTCSGVIALWNTQNPDNRLKLVEFHCIEDEDKYTHIYWKLEYLEP